MGNFLDWKNKGNEREWQLHESACRVSEGAQVGLWTGHEANGEAKGGGFYLGVEAMIE